MYAATANTIILNNHESNESQITVHSTHRIIQLTHEVESGFCGVTTDIILTREQALRLCNLIQREVKNVKRHK